MNIELWQKAVEFHGHKCVGLAFGFRMGEEAKKIFGEDEEIYCKMPVKSCITDGITGSTGASVENGRIQVDESLNHFIFYIKDDDEGWAFRQKKMELPEGTDPVAAVLTYDRDMMITLEPWDM